GRGVEGGEQPLLGPDTRARENVEQGRLAGVGVADDRRRLQLGAAPACALLVALGSDQLDLAIEIADALADTAALDLDLLLAEAAARPHSPAPPTDLPVVGISADQPRQQVMQPRRFDLQATFVRARMLGEDLEDDLGAIEHAGLDRQLEVALLARAEVLVASSEER